MTNETTGADLKSATEQDSKKLFIETYGCHKWQVILHAKPLKKLMQCL